MQTPQVLVPDSPRGSEDERNATSDIRSSEEWLTEQ